MSVTANPRPVLVDSDGGVDDIAALWYLLLHPAVEVVGVTVTCGNVGVGAAADNLARVLHAAGAGDVPVAVGADEPWGAHPALRPATFVHGDDGVGNTGRRPPPWAPFDGLLVDFIADAIAAHGDLLIVALGPLTNLAAFVDAHPAAVPHIGELVVMGGAVTVQGNALPAGEANIAHDPEAAAIVAAAAWSAPPLLVPLDATLAATFGPDEFAVLAHGDSPAARDLRAPIEFYRQAAATFSPPGEMACHDLTAAVLAVEPGLADSPVLPFGVDVAGGLSWGTTVVDRRQPFFQRAGEGSVQAIPDGLSPWRIALDVDVDAVRERYRWLLGDGSSNALPGSTDRSTTRTTGTVR